MRNRIYIFTVRLFPILLMLFLSGCIPVPLHHSVPADTEVIDFPKYQFKRIVVAPYFHRAEVNAFSKALSEANNDIDAVDSATVFQCAFPGRESNTQVAMSDLLQPDVRNRIRACGIRFIIVLSPYQTTSTKGDETFIMVYGHASSDVSTTLMAGLVDLEKSTSLEYLETKARGKDSVTWILPYLGFFIFLKAPETEESAMGGMARQITTGIRKEITEYPLKIMVVAGDWPSAEQTYKKEQTLKALQGRARQEDPDAKWQIYQMQPIEENLVWLCRAAEQRQVNALHELGKLYYFGSDKYRKFVNVHIPTDLPRSCMWFQLAWRAQITKQLDTEDALFRLGPYEIVDIAHTAKAMTAHELAEAEKSFLAWKPGQCDRDFSMYLGAEYAAMYHGVDYVKGSYLAELCMDADKGSFSARDTLGRIYYFGDKGVNVDLPRAYMWYLLAASVYVPPDTSVGNMHPRCDAMTPEQRSIAVKYLEGWKPGKCEQDLLQ